jgi:hypothetical protein
MVSTPSKKSQAAPDMPSMRLFKRMAGLKQENAELEQELNRMRLEKEAWERERQELRDALSKFE